MSKKTAPKSKKTLKKIGLYVTAALLILLVVVLINVYPFFQMKPAETGMIDGTNIIAVKNNLNAIYLIPTESGYIAIDAGTDKGAAEKSLAALSIDPASVQHLLLTHSDYDHTGALPLFANARLYMSADELQMVNGTTKRNAGSYNALPDGIGLGAIELLSDGQTLTLGGVSIQCIASPGHTPGSMSYIVDSKYLFTGDAMRIDGQRLDTHPFTMDEQQAQATVEKLREAKNGCALLFTAHYGYANPETLE